MEEMKEESYLSSVTDELTGIYNRQGFYEFTAKMLEEHADLHFSLIYWNIQKFKVINDLFGRETGDKILINLANALRKEFGNGIATYGRLERDNFICCAQDEVVKSGKWMKLGEINYGKGDSSYHFFCCYGLYKIESREPAVDSMVDKARVAMETVKNNYMKPYAWYDKSMWGSIIEEQKINSNFREAISENQFKVYYQPICRASDGAVVSAEALVRWEQPGKGLVSPGTFIPLFEKNGFISVLDRYVWAEVCRMLKSRIDGGLPTVPVSINVSRKEFYNPHLCEDIRNIAKRYNIPMDLIKIEITESAYSDEPQQVQKAVEKLHEYGFIVLMDDFGSGYSSLNTLKDLPIDVLKIDMKFMDCFEQNQKAAIILEAVVRMAKWMKLLVVAEGVETGEEWEYLKRVECDLVQGYHFYKPMPEADFIEILDRMHGDKGKAPKSEWKDFDDTVIQALSCGNVKENRLLNSMFGGAGVFEMTQDTLEVIQVNAGYYEVVCNLEVELTEKNSIINKPVKEPDRSILMEECRLSKESGKVRRVQIHHKREDNGYVWLDVKVLYLGSRGKRSLFYFTVDNIDKIKREPQES